MGASRECSPSAAPLCHKLAGSDPVSSIATSSRDTLDDLTHGDGSMYSSYDEDIRVLANLDRMMSVGLSLKSDW